MPPYINEAQFNEELDKRGFRIMRPGDDGVVTWGYIDVGGGTLVDRWRGGSTLAGQLAYLIEQKQCGGAVPPPAGAEPTRRKAAKKRAAKKKKGA